MNRSESGPSGIETAVRLLQYSAGLRAKSLRVIPLTALRHASASRAWRLTTFSKPSSKSMLRLSLKPKRRAVAGVYGKWLLALLSRTARQSQKARAHFAER